MRMTHLRFFVTSCALCMLPLTAQSQERQPGQTTPANQQRDQESQLRGQVQPSGQAQQSGQIQQRGQAQQRGQTQQTGQRGEQGRRASQQGEKSVEDFLVQKLILANKAEIELSQMATEKTQNQEVKQFAQMLVQDHQELMQKLQQMESGQTGQSSPDPRIGQVQPGQTQPIPTQPGQTQPDPSQLGQTQPGQDQRTGTPGQDRPGRAGMARAGQGGQVPQQLTQIVEQAAQKHLQMSKKMLQEAEGDEFDKAFVGMQVAKHGAMVAELEAMKAVGSQQFQQLVSTAHSKTTEHLEHAKNLAKKLKGDRQATSSGSRSSSPSARPGAQPTGRSVPNPQRGSN